MEQLVCRNPKAVQRYEIEQKLEAGLVLKGSEVKSLRQGRGDLDGAYASLERNEMFLLKMHIAPYEQAGPYGHDPRRRRKLLLHRREIERLRGKLAQRGYSLVPTLVYFKNGVAKVQLGLGRGKRVGDQRDEIKKKVDLKEARAAVRSGKERRGKNE